MTFGIHKAAVAMAAMALTLGTASTAEARACKRLTKTEGAVVGAVVVDAAAVPLTHTDVIARHRVRHQPLVSQPAREPRQLSRQHKHHCIEPGAPKFC